MTNNWLEKLSKLRVDRAAKNPAPHKPLLLLVIIDQIEDGVVGLIS
jgi:putative restriction endonuclease